MSTLGTERRLTYLPTTSLPPTAPARFAFLFNKQRKWTLDEVTPYIEYATCHISPIFVVPHAHTPGLGCPGTSWSPV